MRIRPVEERDWPEWRRMSEALFPGAPPEEYDADIRALHRNPDAAVFVAERADGSVCGFVEVGSRPYADGCRTSPVGYIEAWYVDPDVRREGFGRALLRAAESWAMSRGFSEMASDALLDNTVSYDAHIRSGYAEVERIVQFRKPLDVGILGDKRGG
jgi:aminoglycoside 6'-N-acetyltransferase I